MSENKNKGRVPFFTIILIVSLITTFLMKWTISAITNPEKVEITYSEFMDMVVNSGEYMSLAP